MHNKKIYFWLFAFLASFFYSAIEVNTQEFKKFVIVITSYNNAKWYQRNLDSVFNQKYPYFRVIYMDDASPDSTGDLVEKYIKEKNQTDRVLLIKNNKWQSQMTNHYRATHMCDDNEIVVQLDGDDWLADDHVLSYLNEVYTTTNTWITYGQCQLWPSGAPGPSQPVPADALAKKSFRGSWMYGHLRSFYVWLFKQIKVQDLMLDSSFVPMAPSPDAAFMIPMLEMACEHITFIPKILYIWNGTNPISQTSTNQVGQWHVIGKVWSWLPYKPFDKPVSSLHTAKKADVIVFSENIVTCKKILASLVDTIKNIDVIYIIPSSLKGSENNYSQLIKTFANTQLIQNTDISIAQFLANKKSHLVLINNPLTANHKIDVSQCINELEKAQAFSFNFIIHQSTDDVKKYAAISDDIVGWQFNEEMHRDKVAFSCNNVIYSKNTILEFLPATTKVSQMQQNWNSLNDKNVIDRNVGLTFCHA